MSDTTLGRRLFAEWLGTAFLLAVVVGSGIMGERLAGGNIAIALLANSLATGAILVVLILIFAPISGAHFNPAAPLERYQTPIEPSPRCQPQPSRAASVPDWTGLRASRRT